jgi:heme-degrading monooxygenase HmoA
MIVRLWRSVAKADMSDAYLDYFRSTGLRDYRATPGNRSVTVLRRPAPDGVEWLIVTSWDSWDAIRAFAGDDPNRARFYPDDARYFVSLDDRVEHYELLLDER